MSCLSRCSTCKSVALLLFSIAQASQGAPGTVYLVVGSDTAIWNAGTTVDVYTRHPHYRQDSFTDTNAPIFQIMNPAWRGQYKDSFGQPIKFTWWMMGGNIYRDADNLNVPVPNTMPLHLMQKYHGQALRAFGDELSLHYHTYLWSDYNGTGMYYWNQARTFNECRSDFEVTLAQYLLEEEVFPVSFRSGWHFMDQDWQARLNQLIPFAFHDNYGVRVPWYTNKIGPIQGIEDWSRAPSVFVPFHPATNDYQLLGNSPAWNVRSVKIQSLNQVLVNQLFSEATNGADQVACFWNHLPEGFAATIAKLASYLSVAASNNPQVNFRYCAAVEAMQRWSGATNGVLPVLEVSQTIQNHQLTLSITSSVPIFQATPFVCLRDVFQQYRDVSSQCVPASINSWSIVLPVSAELLAKVGIAVTDPAGRVARQILRYVPDDIYLDNLEPAYKEGQGNWISITNAAWGTDARAATLSSTLNAQADWDLPITTSWQYHIAVQIPLLTNSATNIVFNIVSDNTNLLSVRLPDGVPANQWTFVGSVPLQTGHSNRVELFADGSLQSGKVAVSDVVRVVPAPGASLPGVTAENPMIFVPSSRGYLIRFVAQAGVSYAIQRNNSLEGRWDTLQIATPSSARVMEYEDEKPPGGQSFYRIVAQ